MVSAAAGMEPSAANGASDSDDSLWLEDIIGSNYKTISNCVLHFAHHQRRRSTMQEEHETVANGQRHQGEQTTNKLEGSQGGHRTVISESKETRRPGDGFRTGIIVIIDNYLNNTGRSGGQMVGHQVLGVGGGGG